MGGDLSPARLLLAYRSGIFPWFGDDDPILWWSPPERCVLYPDGLRVSKSMQQVLRRSQFEFKINTAFEAVITACATAPREGQDGTWITEEMKQAYIALHRMGHAHSAEVWQDGRLAGGLYGVRIGAVFCGESMFSRVSNASKAALIQYTRQLAAEGIKLIDCQNHTAHLESLGAAMIPRDSYLAQLEMWRDCGK